MHEESILPNQPTLETPPYQRFVAFIVQFPVEKGLKVHHRVVITGTHKELANDLSTVLPNRAYSILAHSESDELKVRKSQRRVETTKTDRESYYAVCSCNEKNCEHLTDAIKHFLLIQDIAENSGQIISELKSNRVALQEANENLQSLSTELARKEKERSDLSNEADIKAKDREIEKIRQRLISTQADKDALQADYDTLNEAAQQLEKVNQNLQSSLEVYGRGFSEFGRLASRRYSPPVGGLSDDVTSVVMRHFILEPSNLEPQSKLTPSNSSSHHKASNVEAIAHRLATFEFVKSVVVTYRRKIKHNKIIAMPVVHQLQLIFTDGDSGNLFKIATTATTKTQQYLAAYLIAEYFDARVELK